MKKTHPEKVKRLLSIVVFYKKLVSKLNNEKKTMKPVEYFMNAEGGQIVIDIPEEMQGKKLKVVVMEAEAEKVKKFHELPVEERLKILEQFKGTAKYPDFSIDKYDVYDQ